MMNAVIKLTLALLVTISASLSFGQGGGGVTAGGGGGGFEDNGVVYLADLYLTNSHLNPYIGTEYSKSKLAALTVMDGLKAFDAELLELLAIKLDELEAVDPYFGSAVFEAVRALGWSIVNDSLLLTEDMTTLPIQKVVLPLAVRQGQSVYIQKSNWVRMNQRNQVALIIHEVVAALAPENLPAELTRRLVAHLFDRDFFFAKSKAQRDELLKPWPSHRAAEQRLQRPLANLYSRLHFPTPLNSGVIVEPRETHFEFLSQTVLSPFYFLSSRDVPGVMDKILNRETKDIEEVYSFSPGAALWRLCEAPRGRSQAVRLVGYYYKVVVEPAPLNRFGVTPRFLWSLETEFLIDEKFEPKRSRSVANCSSKNRKVFEWMTVWTESLKGF